MDDASQDPHVQSPSATAHQQRALIGVGQGRAHRGPALDRATGGHGERHDPLFRTFPSTRTVRRSWSISPTSIEQTSLTRRPLP